MGDAEGSDATLCRRMGEFVPFVPAACLCGHTIFDHDNGETCTVPFCGCDQFEDNDQDSDWQDHPDGLYDGWETV